MGVREVPDDRRSVCLHTQKSRIDLVCSDRQLLCMFLSMNPFGRDSDLRAATTILEGGETACTMDNLSLQQRKKLHRK